MEDRKKHATQQKKDNQKLNEPHEKYLVDW